MDFKTSSIKIILWSVLVSFLFLSSYGACNLGIYEQNNDQCPVFTTSELDIAVQGENIKNNDIEIFHKNNNQEVLVENQAIKNSFKYPGVYEARVDSTNLANQQNIVPSKEFIFDNAQPKPPLVKSIIDGNFEVETQYVGDEIIVKDAQGNQITSKTAQSMEPITISEISSNQYIELYTKRNKLESEPIKRYYYNSKPTMGDTLASNPSIDTQQINTVNGVENGKTSHRNFFITGTAEEQDNTYVRVNGQKIPVQNGEYGAFEILNEGENQIEVIGDNGEKSTYSVEYIPNDFSFNSINVEKLISSSSATLTGRTSQDLPFLVYVNGEFYEEITPQDNQFSINIENIEKEKTFIQLKGYNGEEYKTVLYKDTNKPQIKSFNPNELSSQDSLSFLIKDEYGLNESSIEFKINGEDYSGDVQEQGNYYDLPLDELSQGDYEYSVSASDRVGNEHSISGEFTIGDYLKPINITFPDTQGKTLGEHLLFSDNEGIELSFSMNKPFAFEHIYINDREITEYQIYSDNSAIITLPEDINNTGEIEMRYMNKSQDFQTKTYSYEVVDTPQITLDSPTSPTYSNGNSITMISGTIENSDIVDKNTIDIQELIWFGKDFEISGVSNEEVAISGEDIFQREIETTNPQELNTQGSPDEEIRFNPNHNIDIEYEFDFTNPFLYIPYLSGMHMKNTYAIFDDKFSSPQKQGIQVHNYEMKGFSQTKYDLYSIQKIDSMEPKLYLKQTDNSKQILIDGTGSSVDTINIEETHSSCNSNRVNMECIEVSDSTQEITAEITDEVGNNFSGTVNIDSLPNLTNTESLDTKIYFSGKNNRELEEETYLQGQYITSKYPNNISTSHGECEYDDYNFICPINLDYGFNDIEVTIDVATDDGSQDDDSQDEDNSENTTIERPNPSDETIELDEITGENSIFKHDGVAYYIGGDIQLQGENSQDTPITIEINNRQIQIESSNNQFPVTIPKGELSDELNDYDRKEITFQAITEDEETEEEIRSNTLTMIYSKLKDILVSIKLE